MSDSEDNKRLRHANNTGTLGGKRQRRAEEESGGLIDAASQPSILKWMRRVPGPLQDVMKEHADQMDNLKGGYGRVESANSGRYSVTIATVFDQGPWVKMCQYLGMPAVPGTLYGNIRVGALKCSVGSIVESDEALTKIPQLLVLLKSVRYVDEEIKAVLHDPTGEVEGYFHRELVERLGPALVAGVGVLLYKVSVFTPTDAPVTGRRKSYLNITSRNVRQVFVLKEQTPPIIDDPVSIFNNEKEIEAAQDSDHDDYDDKQASRSEQAVRQFLQHSTVQDTSAELTFLSQRQVIHRNPPVRVELGALTTTFKKKSKTGKRGMSSSTPAQVTGLGKWQWSKLLKKTPNDESATDGSRLQERQSFVDASSRLVSLITKQNAKHRLTTLASKEDSKDDDTSVAAPTLKKAVAVHFAPEKSSELPLSRNVDQYGRAELTQKSHLSRNSDSELNQVDHQTDKRNHSDGDDEDDDW